MSTINVPTEKEIAELEKKLAEMKQARDESRKAVFAAMKSDEVLACIGRDDLVMLMRKIQARLVGSHRKVRGSRVSDELKANLIRAMGADSHPTLAELSSMFNLSVSYISRVKSEMKKAVKKSGVINAYEDHQLNFPQREEALA